MYSGVNSVPCKNRTFPSVLKFIFYFCFYRFIDFLYLTLSKFNFLIQLSQLSQMIDKWQFWADRGGTFTDVVGLSPNRTLHVTKVLSDVHISNPIQSTSSSHSDRIGASSKTTNETSNCDTTRGIRRILKLDNSTPIPSEMIEVVKIGTTIGTNALLERRGSKLVYITTAGFRDALIIRHQTRADIFALDVRRPVPLYHEVIEVNERVSATGEVLIPLGLPDLDKLINQLKDFRAKDPMIESCAVVFLHSYLNPDHEIRVGRACYNAGFENVYLSHSTEPIPRLITRAETTVVDAYLTPILSRYISRLSKELGFMPPLSPLFPKGQAMPNDQTSQTSSQLLLMKSDGGLAEASFFKGRDSLLSGPAGGVVGAWKVCQAQNINKVISFDMGGTSTDVSHLYNGLSHRIETDVGGVTLCRSAVDVHTVAAGGGSIIRFDGSRLLVGPQSAGAFPGPSCYRQNGPLTITDCNVVLGRIQPDGFPEVFGLNGDQQIDVEVVKEKFGYLRDQITRSYVLSRNKRSEELKIGESNNGKNLDREGNSNQTPEWMKSSQGVAEKFVEIAVQQMATAIKKISSDKGVYIEDHVLCCFGGAGGQHACRLAEVLGLKKILIHPLASVLSAVGIGLADVTRTAQVSVGLQLTQSCLDVDVNPLVKALGVKVSRELELQQIPVESQLIKIRLRLGYKGTDTVLVIDYHTQSASLFLSNLSASSSSGDSHLQTPVIQLIASTPNICHPIQPNLRLFEPIHTESVDGKNIQIKHLRDNEAVKFIPEALPNRPANLFGRSAISLHEEFIARHQTEFGFRMAEEHQVDIASIEVEATSECKQTSTSDWDIKILDSHAFNTSHMIGQNSKNDVPNAQLTSSKCDAYVNGEWHSIPLLQLWELPTSGQVQGPAIIIDPIGTSVILSGWTASWDVRRCLVLKRVCKSGEESSEYSSTASQPRPTNLEVADPFWLELFNHYFRSVAEEMGVILQRTSQSINIKERLDFSCAVFDSSGNLIANAPHIPVHLGSMGESVKSLIQNRNGCFISGQVFASNNPFNGGTHLPDITVITPVFLHDHRISPISCTYGSPTDNQSNDALPIGFVASRGHHADIGGSTPGSMPATSRSLSEEGIVLDNLLIVDPTTGQFMTDVVRTTLEEGKWPARDSSLNIADLQAQVAANRRGVEELRLGVKTFGKDVMNAYAQHVLDGGEKAVRCAIKQLELKSGRMDENSFICCMDRGEKICVQMRIDKSSGTVDINFEGTSETDPFNFNAPFSVLKAAVLYVFRILISDGSVPLNEGCFRPLQVHVPEDCLVNPRQGAAVAAGNVEISQCAVNALFGCLGVLAAGQGTMNNITFGSHKFQYYETLCGGTGAGPNFAGCSAIHSHMTNSRITDPELFESRLPVIVLEFSIRRSSGGEGQFFGGDGAIRKLLFLDDVGCTILSGQREVAPFGLNGGKCGSIGRNRVLVCVQNDQMECWGEMSQSEKLNSLRPSLQLLIESSEFESNLGPMFVMRELKGRDSINIHAGDVLIIETPGGGGFGHKV